MRENKRAGARKVMIEKRKEDAERQLAMQERKEEEDRLLQARLAEATEEERRRQERCVGLLGLSSSESQPQNCKRLRAWLMQPNRSADMRRGASYSSK